MSTHVTYLPYDPRHIRAYHCAHLRHSGTSVFEAGAEGRPLSQTSYWCACTRGAVGPDGHPVSSDDCAFGRRCCEH